jgi:hypothetical protein
VLHQQKDIQHNDEQRQAKEIASSKDICGQMLTAMVTESNSEYLRRTG